MKQEITFIHHDGTQRTFATERNELTGDQMYTWDNWDTCSYTSKKHVLSIIRDIIDKTTVISNH